MTVPLSLPGIVAGSLLVFVPAVGEFVIPDLLGGGNVLMIGNSGTGKTTIMQAAVTAL